MQNYDTFHVVGPTTDKRHDRVTRRTPEQVAQDITDVYLKVAQGGGRIIAGHELQGYESTLEDPYVRKPTTSYLMLVAEYADTPVGIRLQGAVDTEPAPEV